MSVPSPPATIRAPIAAPVPDDDHDGDAAERLVLASRRVERGRSLQGAGLVEGDEGVEIRVGLGAGKSFCRERGARDFSGAEVGGGLAQGQLAEIHEWSPDCRSANRALLRPGG
ncbi:hypothetical protein ABIA96_000850 [Bradyrhizobium sp. LB11.1]